MKMKLVLALVAESKTEKITEAVREAGGTGATILTNARGEGLNPKKTFLGLDMTSTRDLLIFLVAEKDARMILETISEVGGFDTESGSGIAFEISVDDVVGLETQLPTLLERMRE